MLYIRVSIKMIDARIERMKIRMKRIFLQIRFICINLYHRRFYGNMDLSNTHENWILICKTHKKPASIEAGFLWYYTNYIAAVVFLPQLFPDFEQQDLVDFFFFPLSAKLTPDTNITAVANRNTFFIFCILF
jgi:hypothetical protein